MHPRPLSDAWYLAQLRRLSQTLDRRVQAVRDARREQAWRVDVEGTGHGGREGVYAVDDLPSQRYREE